MSVDPEMQQWQAGWKTSSSDSMLDSKGQADAIRQEARLRRLLVIEMTFAVFFLSGSLWVALVDGSGEMILWAVCIWITTLIASSFSLWNWQSLWRASAQPVADYITQYRSRTMARLRASTVGLVFLGFQDCVSICWFSVDLSLGRVTVVRFCIAMFLLLVLTATFTAMFVVARRKALGELKRIEQD